MDTTVSPASRRIFYPTNREDALFLLAGLILPRLGGPGMIGLVLRRGDGVPLVEEGLRESENEIAARGNAQRFPLLIEVSGCQATAPANSVSLDRIHGLCFRTEAERDDFLYRQVSEWSPDGTKTSVEPQLFGLEGEPRIGLASGVVGRLSQVADRIAGGVACLLQLGELDGKFLPEMASAFACYGDSDESFLHGLLASSIRWITAPDSNERTSRHKATVVRVFGAADRVAGRALIQNVWEALASDQVDESVHKRERLWYETCVDIWNNNQDLDGGILSDNGAIYLRAALLASKADSVSALAAFTKMRRPSGLCVTCIAAYLLGLKIGLSRLHWQHKEPYREFLSAVHVNLMDNEPADWHVGLNLQFSIEGKASSRYGCLAWERGPLIRSKIKPASSAPPPSAEERRPAGLPSAPPPPPESLEDLNAPPPEQPVEPWLTHLLQLGCQRVSTTSIALLSGSVVMFECDDDLPHVPCLCKELFEFDQDALLALLKLNARPANLWRLAIRRDRIILTADLPEPPSLGTLRLLEARLTDLEQLAHECCR